MTDTIIHSDLTFTQPFSHAEKQLLTPEAQQFLLELVTHFSAERERLLVLRQRRQQRYDAGQLPDFDMETASIRESAWRIGTIPDDLLDRRVEITGPPERKMVINALNANVKVYMADFEDSLTPQWDKLMEGQQTLCEAVKGTLSFTSESGKIYQLRAAPAVLMCRVRGLHLDEKHVQWQGKAIPGGLFDFALYFFHNVSALLSKGSGPYFYLPKSESWQEAAWWREIFCFAEDRFQLPRGTIKVTVLIETLPAVFQMDEILWNLRDHIVGLNCGRWDYIFSYIKTLRQHGDRILPDRQSITMAQPFLDAYSRLLVKTCHRRGAFAMGGMSALIPAKERARNEWVLQRVREDKQREADNGHDGTWIAHPGLADTAMAVFDAALDERQNQLDVLRENDAPVDAAQLLAPCAGERTEAGMRANIRVALRYLEAWLGGNGCVPIDGLMEDAATAEIARTSIWQWIHHQQTLSDGQPVSAESFLRMLDEERCQLNDARYDDAARLMAQITTEDELVSFLTLPGYRLIP
ncbi:MAG: malate synthase A [Pantoea sp.]|uniref:Malate synthase n=1 Tax=Pantoea septica TaxID=472695 RepID=A0ABX3UPV0_9GAMM|nr:MULTISPECIES: malate synthase A [Pantoea]MDU5781709.1 malate synthase A [Pantoea sp.]ORM97831.1 malate synthase A [Pantoea septica]